MLAKLSSSDSDSNFFGLRLPLVTGVDRLGVRRYRSRGSLVTHLALETAQGRTLHLIVGTEVDINLDSDGEIATQSFLRPVLLESFISICREGAKVGSL